MNKKTPFELGKQIFGKYSSDTDLSETYKTKLKGKLEAKHFEPLDEEERDLIEGIERGDYISGENTASLIEHAKKTAENTLRKLKNG